MNKPFPSLSAGVVALSVLAFSAHSVDAATPYSTPTVGVYDSTNNSNTVDRNAIGNVSTFTTGILTAFNNGMGGVINFDGQGSITSDQNIVASYGLMGSPKSLTINTGQVFNIQFSSNIIAISGTENAGTGNFLLDNPAVPVATYTIGSITNGVPGEFVSQIGFTVLTRNGGGTPTITATANYSDATNQQASAAFTVSTARNEDTFFGFAAPTGASITSFTIDYGGNGDLRRGIDDLGFITSTVVVPEPSYAMAFGGLSLLLVGQRFCSRRSSLV